ncbi:cell wall metabolism sensor histidine kinase WalK [Rhizobium sp. L1K21]|uniref:sensor histidine kinase n=1 Tax=Rhizobium sp. L1K21 TaxID=2954933 RepID=UPI002093B146|nr:ATP-binding protein [Rhizobium sp. L1K21]MCO6185096.1 ATP-binding protein [Rhizobium sp. L1K21]
MKRLPTYVIFRFILVFWVAMLVLWLLFLFNTYRKAPWQSEMLPSPTRIAAIVHLMETTPPGSRKTLVEAFSSDLLFLKLEPGDRALDRFDDLPVYSRYEVADYNKVLGGRHFSISQIALADAPWPDAGRSALLATLEFRIALDTGETLILDARSPFLANATGLPVGLFAGLLGSLIGLVVLILVILVSRPLREIAEAVETLELGQGPHRLPNKRVFSVEVRRLWRAYNALQDRIALLLKNRMELIGGISHDVRTFASRLRLKVEGIDDPAARDSAISDIEDMIRLLDDALMTSKAGAGELQEELISLQELVGSECRAFSWVGKAVTFCGSVDDDRLLVLGDRMALRRVIANLIDNAVKYGERAIVGLSKAETFALLTVDDRGPGIPDDQKAAMLEPFQRLETSRSRETGGAGLGLSIVRALLEAHGGDVSLADAPEGGLRVLVRLPLFRPDQS